MQTYIPIDLLSLFNSLSELLVIQLAQLLCLLLCHGAQNQVKHRLFNSKTRSAGSEPPIRILYQIFLILVHHMYIQGFYQFATNKKTHYKQLERILGIQSAGQKPQIFIETFKRNFSLYNFNLKFNFKTSYKIFI